VSHTAGSRKQLSTARAARHLSSRFALWGLHANNGMGEKVPFSADIGKMAISAMVMNAFWSLYHV
jgi:hypothetical protein